MKKLLVTLFCLSVIIINAEKTNGQSGPEAAKYMDQVMGPAEGIKNECWQYTKAIMHSKGANKIEKKRISLLNEIKSAKIKISKMGAYDSDDSYRQSILNFLDIYYIVLNEDFSKILDMEDIAEQSYDNMEAYLLSKEKASEKLDEASKDLSNAQKEFGKNHDVNIIEGEADKISQKLKKASKALSYQNKLYLIFFKCNKQEAYIIDAMKRNDVNALQQNINSLSEFVKEGNEKLKKVGDYNGSGPLKSALIQSLRFYKSEAEKDFPEMVDFYIKKDNYDKLTKQMNLKSQSERTQQDVDKYNKAVKEYNKAVNDYNMLNNKLNNTRSSMIDQFNQQTEAFFSANS